MKYLALALLLCALASLSSGFCYFRAEKLGMTHCQDDVDQTWHAVGSTWRNSRCMNCNCNSCCSAYATPKRFPEECISVFDSKACQYVVHKKDDPSVLCPIFAAVGK
ncbi:beta-microseminoprotein J1-like [Etheostoma cragini]|uniref:beta-microseminoprotein J1-like n=1 Tax=Etheostoma cragini TaxID=417921 RepID=UPI00155E2AA6|nr:beta-microseminoprotein J1-like [Etheostoma cragini]